MRIEVDKEWGIPRVTDKAEIREQARKLFGEGPSVKFRDCVRKLLLKDKYRKSVSRELPWAILAAAVMLAEQAELYRNREKAAQIKREEDRIKELGELWSLE